MNIKLSFLGAAKNVTGSKFLLEVNGSKILVDCGLYQERDFRCRNWEKFPISPKSIDAILLTHAHLDHCGFIPKLKKEGFEGKVYATAATVDISKIVLLDSGHLQEEDAAYKKKRHKKEGRCGPHPEVPLYTAKDAEDSFSLLRSVPFDKSIEIVDGISATWREAGHILGSATIEVEVRNNGNTKKIVFSGDIGRWDKPILRDPEPIKSADYLLIESTYGDRVHQDEKTPEEMLEGVINDTVIRGGNIIIPSFALERAQEILYHLNNLLLEERIPPLMVFVDSPMAIDVTNVFKRHPELYDEEMSELIENHESPFSFPGLQLTRTTSQSKAINNIKGSAIIIAGSGMCTGGRIKHHLANNISRPESTILFVGYQAVGTLGRQIVEGAKEVRILGKMHEVKAQVVQINGFSGHADRNELLRWLNSFERDPKHTFVVHGEPESSSAFAELIRSRKGWDCSIPEYGQMVNLS